MIRRDRHARQGYSLFEVLVALTIMALTAALVLPGLGSGLRSAARHTAAMELEQQINALRRRAQMEGVARTLAPLEVGSADAARADLVLPQGWTYRTVGTLTFYPDGSCQAGGIFLERAGAPPLQFEIESPRCRPSLV